MTTATDTTASATTDMQRLADRVLKALELALDQQDAGISALLAQALELSLTRNAGGADFVERREFEERIGKAFARCEALRKNLQA